MGNVQKTYATAIASFLFLSFSYSPGWSQETHYSAEGGGGGHVMTSGQTSSSVPLDKISNEFSTFLGDNSDAVVYGLRSGDEIIFEETIIHDDGTTSTITTPIDPPTGSMGNGNVKISLGLAREELSKWGIDQPTGEELNAALVGGEITAPSGGTVQLDGVLTMRSEGMGWGQIAHEYGVKLGHVMRDMKTGKDYSGIPEATPKATGTGERNRERTRSKHGAKATSEKGYGKGIVSGTNETHHNRHTIQAKATKQHKQSYKHSVTGSGATVGGNSHATTASSAGSSGHGHSYGHGIVSATGASVTTATSASNATHTAKASNSSGKGLAKGHYK